MKMKHKVTLCTAFLVALMSAVLVAVGYYEISHTFYQQILNEQESRMRVAWSVLTQQGAPFHIQNGKLLAGNVVLNENGEIVGQIAALVGGSVTIFQGDRRIATNVRFPDGSRAVGTIMTHKPAMAMLFKQHKPFRGEATILGDPYVTAYDPIKDSDDNIIGVLEVAGKRSAYSSTLSSILGRSIFVTILGVLFIGIIVYLALHYLTHELQEMGAQRRLLLESIGEGIYGVDFLGRCTFINHTGAEMLGFSPAELVGKEIHSMIHHSQPGGAPNPVAECRLCKLFPKEQVRRNDEVFWKKNGGAIPVRYLSSPIVDRGTVRGAVVAFNNRTERKRVEPENKESSEMALHDQSRLL